MLCNEVLKQSKLCGILEHTCIHEADHISNDPHYCYCGFEWDDKGNFSDVDGTHGKITHAEKAT